MLKSRSLIEVIMEQAFILAALCDLVPMPSSAGVNNYHFGLIGGAFSLFAFSASRALRWRGQDGALIFTIFEGLAFAIFLAVLWFAFTLTIQ